MNWKSILAIAVATTACGGPDAKSPPDRDPGDSTDAEEGRRVQRLTADQFHRSLIVATGQSWGDYGEFAATLGRADFVEINDEGRDLSITFDKLVHDAARDTCKRAVNLDVGAPDAGVILRHATVSDRDAAAIDANLMYLLLRFHGVKASGPDDARLLPWQTLLHHDDGSGSISDEAMNARWKAVCVGLVTHADFLTY